jgi:tripartite-type tricarboxylate transporter receptor subunit TctC
MDFFAASTLHYTGTLEGTMKPLTLALTVLSVLFAIPGGHLNVYAQPYPNRPIQLIIGQTPGAAGDITCRPLADELGKILGVQVIVINKPGASGTLGVDAVARSKKDGYTLAYTNTSGIVYARASSPETVPYDPFKDLDPLGLHLFFPLTVTVQENAPWKTFSEFIDSAKKNPGKIRVGTHGQGSIDHFNLELMQSVTGAQFNHIPFKGGTSVTTALLGGHVEAVNDAFTLVLPHLKSGKLRMLLQSKKTPDFPDVPTMSQVGYNQELLSAWFALHAPIGIPEDVKKILVSAIERAIKSPAVKERIEKMGYIVDYKSPAELKKLSMEDYETANAIAVKLGLHK